MCPIQQPVYVTHPVTDIEDTTWVEEQRVARAIWRWLLFALVKENLNGTAPFIGGSVQRITSMSLDEFYLEGHIWTASTTLYYGGQLRLWWGTLNRRELHILSEIDRFLTPGRMGFPRGPRLGNVPQPRRQRLGGKEQTEKRGFDGMRVID